jgi:hypothetical protein
MILMRVALWPDPAATQSRETGGAGGGPWIYSSPMPLENDGGRKLVVLIGTVKGAFFYQTDLDRHDWELTGPHLAGWEVYSLCGDSRNRRVLAGTCSYTYGATLRETRDLGATWQEVQRGPACPAKFRRELGRPRRGRLQQGAVLQEATEGTERS